MDQSLRNHCPRWMETSEVVRKRVPGWVVREKRVEEKEGFEGLWWMEGWQWK